MAVGFMERECVNCGSGSNHHQTVITTTVSHNCHLRGRTISAVACQLCGLVFLNPAPTDEAIVRLYRHDLYQRPKKPKKSGCAAAAGTGRVTKQHLHGFLLEAHGALKNLTVLDIGCMNGKWLTNFDSSNELHGVELSPMVNYPIESRLILHRADFMEFELSDTKFNLVTANALIEHLKDPVAALVKINGLMKMGGGLFLYTPDIHHLGLQSWNDKYFKVVHLYYFSVATLSSLLYKTGFAVRAVRQYPLVRSTSPFTPRKEVVGTFALLACKERNTSLEEARLYLPATDHREFIASLQAINATRSRDRICALMARLRRIVS